MANQKNDAPKKMQYTANLIGHEPYMEGREQGTYKGEKGMFYKHTVKFDNNIVGVALSTKPEGNYKVNSEYSFTAYVDTNTKEIRIQGMKRTEFEGGGQGGGYKSKGKDFVSYYDRPEVQWEVTKAWAHDLAAEECAYLVEDEQDKNSFKFLYELLMGFVYGNNHQTTELLARRQAIATALKLMKMPGMLIKDWDKLKEEAEVIFKRIKLPLKEKKADAAPSLPPPVELPPPAEPHYSLPSALQSEEDDLPF